ncbi:MAG: 50S ribosomal protein L21 [bacterium]|nr:50S ribosomal protein L21 [bacterium]
MAKFAVVKTGGKQYLVKQNDEIVVDKVLTEEKKDLELETLATFDSEGSDLTLGTPLLESKVKATVVGHMKGDKIRVAKFKAKVRFRRVTGFRPQLSKLKIVSI